MLMLRCTVVLAGFLITTNGLRLDSVRSVPTALVAMTTQQESRELTSGGIPKGTEVGKPEDWQASMRTWWDEHPPSSLAQSIWESQRISGQSKWQYTRLSCIQGKFRRVAQIMKNEHCGPTIGEVGGGLNSMNQFYHDYSLYVDLEPSENLTTSEGAHGSRTMRLPFVLSEYAGADFFRAKFKLPASFDCAVALGLHAPKGIAGFQEFVSHTRIVIIERAASNKTKEINSVRDQLVKAGFTETSSEIYECTHDKEFMDAEVPFQDGHNMTHEEKLWVGTREIYVFRK